MLIYFHNHKLRYEKGQLAPFFILILVLLIVMAMVTVNLSKVAFIKTDSSNAVDSGALAAGSVMANVFNAVALSNSQMETFYWESFASISISFTIALTFLTMAYFSASAALASATAAADSACPDPCAAIIPAQVAATSAGAAASSLNSFWGTTMAISLAITAFSLAQYYFYLSIRDMAEKGREQAIKLGHNFTFINSGIGSKLKQGSPPPPGEIPPLEGITEQDQKNNYRNEFSRFLDKEIGHNPEYTYPWEDGQQRKHYVRVKVDIDPVDTFDLRVAVLPTLLITAPSYGLLGLSLDYASSAQASLITAQASYTTAGGLLKMACYCYEEFVRCTGCCPGCGPHCGHCCACCACIAPNLECWMSTCAAADSALTAGIAANSAAISNMTAIFPLMAAAWAGLLPGPIITDSNGVIASPFIICWIDDIVHNRLVRVETWQAHQGADYGMWKTKYPAEWNPEVHKEPLPNERIESYSVVDFRGLGKIHPPKLKHDPSIIETDRIGSSAP